MVVVICIILWSTQSNINSVAFINSLQFSFMWNLFLLKLGANQFKPKFQLFCMQSSWYLHITTLLILFFFKVVFVLKSETVPHYFKWKSRITCYTHKVTMSKSHVIKFYQCTIAHQGPELDICFSLLDNQNDNVRMVLRTQWRLFWSRGNWKKIPFSLCFSISYCLVSTTYNHDLTVYTVSHNIQYMWSHKIHNFSLEKLYYTQIRTVLIETSFLKCKSKPVNSCSYEYS